MPPFFRPTYVPTYLRTYLPTYLPFRDVVILYTAVVARWTSAQTFVSSSSASIRKSIGFLPQARTILRPQVHVESIHCVDDKTVLDGWACFAATKAVMRQGGGCWLLQPLGGYANGSSASHDNRSRAFLGFKRRRIALFLRK